MSVPATYAWEALDKYIEWYHISHTVIQNLAHRSADTLGRILATVVSPSVLVEVKYSLICKTSLIWSAPFLTFYIFMQLSLMHYEFGNPRFKMGSWDIILYLVCTIRCTIWNMHWKVAKESRCTIVISQTYMVWEYVDPKKLRYSVLCVHEM